MITFSNIGHMGRLANQMFQFASTVGTARKRGYDVKFPIENFSSDTPDSYNGCKLLDCFDVPDSYLTDRDTIAKSINYIYRENDFRYNPEVEYIPDGIDLYGYFQNEKYFLDSKDEITECFKFKIDIVDKASTYINDFKDSVSIHVRRGDYVNQSDHHPVQSVDYYYKALEIVGSKKVFIFSDDIEWCRENIKIEAFDLNFMDINNPYISMYLMSRCENNIIANSSFSWWSSWLNQNTNKKVIGPKLWFGDVMNKDTSDVLPKEWISI